MSLRDWAILRQLCPDFCDTIRMAFVFGKTGNEAILVTNDKVYGVGKNCSGCLGVGDSKAHPLPKEIIPLSDENIEGIACGGDPSKSRVFVLACTRTGEIYQWGKFPGENSATVPLKNLVISLSWKVTAVACGYSHCMILCDDGKVCTWGKNNRGQLGLPRDETYEICYWYGCAMPCQVKGILDGKCVIDISCGGSFSVVLLDGGKVVTWGNNECGQLGTNSRASHSTTPHEVSGLNELKMKKVVCGSAHVLALSENNMLYGWGNNRCSQLGFSNLPNPSVTTYRTAMDLSTCVWNRKIIDIGASYACDLSVVQCESKEVFMFGKLASGQILSAPTNSKCESIDQVFAFYSSPNMMPKPVKQTSEAERRTTERRSTVLDILEREFGNPDTSDLTIIADGKEIHVHQAILKMRSEYFKIMLARWLKKDEKVVTIKNKSFIVINTYLRYLYTDKLEVDLNLAVDLLQLADEYGDEDFKFLCENSIKRDMKADKVADVYVLTRKLRTCEDLTKFCLDFILNHTVEVVNSPGFVKWDVEAMMAVFIKYVEKKENC